MKLMGNLYFKHPKISGEFKTHAELGFISASWAPLYVLQGSN